MFRTARTCSPGPGTSDRTDFPQQCFEAFFTPGSGGSRRRRPTASSGPSTGGSIGFRSTADRAGGRQPPRGAATHGAIGEVMADTDAFFTPPPTTEYRLTNAEDGTGLLTFPSAFTTPHPENNTVYCRYFRTSRSQGRPRAAVLVLPQWNADPGGHVGLCRLLNWNGMSALRLALPYHDQRMPPELHRADYIVSANVARTVQVCRQAVLDARRAIHWLAAQGYERIGILGTSLGSCLSLLTTAHEPLVPRGSAESHLAVFRRCRLARPVDRARPRGTERPRRARSAPRAVEADQPALVSRASARLPHAAGLRALRSVVPG